MYDKITAPNPVHELDLKTVFQSSLMTLLFLSFGGMGQGLIYGRHLNMSLTQR